MSLKDVNWEKHGLKIGMGVTALIFAAGGLCAYKSSTQEDAPVPKVAPAKAAVEQNAFQ